MRRIISLFMIIAIFAALSICGTFADTSPVPYADASSWAVPELDRASEYGFITDKIKDGMKGTVTREELAELAVLLYEKFTGTKAAPADRGIFSDTENSEVFKAYNLDIVEGTNTFWRLFSPEAFATREQVAVFLYRTIRAKDPEADLKVSSTAAFSDEEAIAPWAREAVKFMGSKEFIKGADGSINPRGTCTREMAVLIITRIYEEYDSGNSETEIPGNTGYQKLDQIVVNDTEINRDNYQIREKAGKEYILISSDKFKYAFKQPDAGYYTYPEISIIGGSISVNWSSEYGIAMHVEMEEGSGEALLGGAMVDMGIAPFRLNGKMYIPIDFLMAERKMDTEVSSSGDILYIQYREDFHREVLVGTWSDTELDIIRNFDKISDGTMKASAFSNAYRFNADGTYVHCIASTLGDSNDMLILHEGKYRIMGNTILCYDIKETFYKGAPLILQYKGKEQDKST